MTIISWIGDELTKNGYFDKAPELELFRHLRNGISHGNKFHFVRHEPTRPAKFKSFEITPALKGNGVLFEFMSPGDLFDRMQAHLRSLR